MHIFKKLLDGKDIHFLGLFLNTHADVRVGVEEG